MSEIHGEPQPLCRWCGRPFKAPKVVRGKPQIFCCPACRAQFWKHARRWVGNAVTCGLLTVDAIKAGGAAVYGSSLPRQTAAQAHPLKESTNA